VGAVELGPFAVVAGIEPAGLDGVSPPTIAPGAVLGTPALDDDDGDPEPADELLPNRNSRLSRLGSSAWPRTANTPTTRTAGASSIAPREILLPGCIADLLSVRNRVWHEPAAHIETTR
jgi:hypothetical protein